MFTPTAEVPKVAKVVMMMLLLGRGIDKEVPV